MSAGFTSPGVMFVGPIPKVVRDFMAPVLKGLRSKGYEKFVETCSGSLAVSILATETGWKPSEIEASDVTLYSSVLGYLCGGRDLSELNVQLDGEPLELEGSPERQAAIILYTDMKVRMEKKDHIPYWADLVEDLEVRADEHLTDIENQLKTTRARLGGLDYQPLDLWDHIEQVANDPKAVISCNPPSYTSGYETFFDTGGRITWSEPDYRVFDPAVGYDELMEYAKDKPALFLFYYEDLEPGTYPDPLFVRPKGMQKRSYVLSNRPEEITAINGGPKIAPRPGSGIEKAEDRPILPLNYEITEESVIQGFPVDTKEADYYRAIWMHKFKTSGGSYNILYTIDGYAAGIVGYALDPLTRPLGPPTFLALLRFAFGAPHNLFRTTRLITMMSLRKQELEMFRNAKNSLHLEACRGLITNARTKYPESKSLRGIMKLKSRKEEDGQNMLIYVADWNGLETREDVLKAWLKKERHWQKTSTKAVASK